MSQNRDMGFPRGTRGGLLERNCWEMDLVVRTLGTERFFFAARADEGPQDNDCNGLFALSAEASRGY